MKKDSADQKFEVGDRVKFVLRSGKIEEGVIRAVILTTAGPALNVSFGPTLDLAASVNTRRCGEACSGQLNNEICLSRSRRMAANGWPGIEHANWNFGKRIVAISIHSPRIGRPSYI
jgi:hypothetical protein